MFAPNLFDHLKPVAKFFELTLHGVSIPAENPKSIVLRLAFCGRGSPFWNALNKSKPLSDETENQKRIAGLLARYGVVEWLNVAKDGKPVPYSIELGEFVLSSLIGAGRPEIVENALMVAGNPDNFTETPVMSAAEAVELGKG